MSDHADKLREALRLSHRKTDAWDAAYRALDALVAERDLARTKLMDMHTWGEEWKVEARTAKAEVARLKDICDTMTGPTKLQEVRDEVDRWKRAYAEERGLREGEEARGDYAEDEVARVRGALTFYRDADAVELACDEGNIARAVLATPTKEDTDE